MLTCQELVSKVERLQPEAKVDDIARLCLMLANHTDNIDDFYDDSYLAASLQELNLQLQSMTDQHAAMTSELEYLARSSRGCIAPGDIHRLLRAIKVQNQVLQLYVGTPAGSVL